MSEESADCHQRLTPASQHSQQQQQQQSENSAATISPTENMQAQQQQQQQQQQYAHVNAIYWLYEIELPYWLLTLTAVWLSICAVAMAVAYQQSQSHWADFKSHLGIVYAPYDDYANPPVKSLSISTRDLIGRLGHANARLYALLDRDGNGLVSLAEFEPLVHHVRQDAGHPVSRQITADSVYPACGDGQSCVRLRYRVTPPVALPKDNPNSSESRVPYLRYDPHTKTLATVANNVTGPAASAASQVAEILGHFSSHGSVDTEADVDSVAIATAFLPGNPVLLSQLRVGEPYTLLGTPKPGMLFFLAKPRRISRGVYFEPNEVAMATVLRPLHRNLFLYPRHTAGADSAAAVLRAESPTHMEIAFRLHPELQLANQSASQSVYLTPPGLEGRLVIRKGSGVVELFHLNTSSSTSSYWHLASPHDIVESGQVAVPEFSVNQLTTSGFGGFESPHNWTEEIPEAEAYHLLRSRMLAHLSASFHGNLSSALSNAAANGEGDKPIHVLVGIGGPQFGCDVYCRTLRDLALADRLVGLRLRHYYVNAWINFADTAALSELDQLTGGTVKPKPPLSGHLLDPKTLRQLAEFQPDELRKALHPPEGLPSPLPPMPESLASGDEEPYPPKRPGNLLTDADDGQPSPHQEDSLSEEARHQLETKAMEAIRQQLAEAYMRFLRSSKA